MNGSAACVRDYRGALVGALVLFSILAITIIALAYPAGVLAATTVSVRDFGAVGDGVTNDSAAVQRAMNVSGEKTVTFPAGTYALRNVRVPSDTTVVFQADAKIRAATGSGSGDHLFTVLGSTTARLHDVSFSGGSFNGAGINSVVKALYVDRLTITGISETDAVYCVAAGYCDDVAITDSSALRGETGFEFTTCTDVAVERCTARDMGYDGILFYKASRGLVARDNTIDGYCTSHVSGRGGIHVYGSTEATITGNSVQHGEYDSVGIRFRDSNVFWCAENYIEAPGKYGMAVVRIGDYPGLDGGDGTFIRNTVVNAKVRGIDAAYAQSKPIRVLDNIVKGTQDTLAVDPAAGIRVKAPGSAIVGNAIEDTEGNGIEVGGNRIVVVRNTITDCADTSNGPRVGVWVEGTNASVVENKITDSRHNMVSGVKLYTGSSAVVRDNTVSGNTGTALVYQGTKLSSVGGDTQNPTIAQAQRVASGMTLLTISATDASGIAAITYRVDGGAKVTVPGPSVSLTLSTLPEHTVEYSAIDGAGNATAFTSTTSDTTKKPETRRKTRTSSARTTRASSARARAISTSR